MKVALLTLLLYCTSLLTTLKTWAQEGNPDSLYQLITKQNLPQSQILKYAPTVIRAYALTQPQKAISLAHSTIVLAQSAADLNTKAEVLRLEAIAHNTIGNKDSAAFLCNEAKQIFTNKGNKMGIGNCLMDLARLNRKLKKLEEAIRYYDEAEQLFTQLKNETKLAEVYNESGVAYEYKEDYDEAIRRYNASLAIQQRLHSDVGIGYALEFLGGVYGLKNDFAKAEKYLFEALHYRKKTKDSFALALNYSAIADLYKKQNKVADAQLFYERSTAIATSIHYTDLIMYNYGMLAEMAEARGDSKKALALIKIHNQLKDSLNNAQKIKQLDELNVQYETEKNKSIIQQQKLDLLRRNAWIGGIAALLVLASLIYYFKWRSNKMKAAARLQQEILKQQEITTQAVIKAEEEERHRIARDLHDGVGQMMAAARMNISALESLMQPLEAPQKLAFQKIETLVDDSVKEVRSVSHNMMANALLKNSLATAIRDFIDKLDHKKLHVQLYTEGLDQRMNSDLETVLYRIIQECVNNVIKHADANKLHITITKDEEGIRAMIEDNGKGFDSSNVKKFEGIGLKNIFTRVQYLKGTIDIDTAPGKGTLVAIFIPNPVIIS